MGRYVTLSDVKLYAGISGTADDTLIEACITRAEGAIDTYTRRVFVGTPGTYAASRFEQWRVVDLAFYLPQDLHTLSSLTLGDGRVVPVGANGSVWLEPRTGPPYRIVRLKTSIGAWVWNTDQDALFAGTWGYGTVAPDDIQQATIRAAVTYYRQKDAGPTDVVGAEAIGQQTIRGLPQDVIDILSRYRSRTAGAV